MPRKKKNRQLELFPQLRVKKRACIRFTCDNCWKCPISWDCSHIYPARESRTVFLEGGPEEVSEIYEDHSEAGNPFEDGFYRSDIELGLD